MNQSLEYNTERNNLNIPEYGRHIQKLVEHCKKLKSKEERNKMANAIIGVMGNLNPHLRDIADFQHKLWYQLFIIANFELDVDSPYPVPTQEDLAARPPRMPYPQKQPKYRFYGNNIQSMINVALSWEKGEKREALSFIIANHMKKSFLNWNKDSVDDSVIFKHLLELSNGEINLEPKDENLLEAKGLIHRTIPSANPPSNPRSFKKNVKKQRTTGGNNLNKRRANPQ